MVNVTSGIAKRQLNKQQNLVLEYSDLAPEVSSRNFLREKASGTQGIVGMSTK